MPNTLCGNNSLHEVTFNQIELLALYMSYDDEIKFRVGPEKEAAKVIDNIRVGGVNISQIAREGFAEKLREIVTDDYKIKIYEMYEEGEIDEGVARVILGDDIDLIEDDIREFESAKEQDTSKYLAE